ncbi:hypothetical protein C6497_03525 [Candidatus Poribacteria bacterium]|nr:MAG: hypothetical protein C6497_03525 [Candidatus Poribacteria bacterium]
MLKWKHLFLSLGFLFLTVIIGWTTWYITIVRPKIISEPVVIYNVKEPKAANKNTDTLVVKSSEKKNNIQADDAIKPQNGASQSKVVKEKNDSVETKQKSDQNKHSSETHQHSKEDLARWAKEIKELKDMEKVMNEKLAYFHADLKNIEKRSQRRLKEKANRLNSLSAKEQQAYFDDMRNGLAENPSDYFDSIQNTAQSAGIPDLLTSIFLEDFKQIIREGLSEEDVREHLEELRAHGFKPKF